jgi:hypothetical protein
VTLKTLDTTGDTNSCSSALHEGFFLCGGNTPSILKSTLDGGVRTAGIRKSGTKTRVKEEKMESKK